MSQVIIRSLALVAALCLSLSSVGNANEQCVDRELTKYLTVLKGTASLRNGTQIDALSSMVNRICGRYPYRQELAVKAQEMFGIDIDQLPNDASNGKSELSAMIRHGVTLDGKSETICLGDCAEQAAIPNVVREAMGDTFAWNRLTGTEVQKIVGCLQNESCSPEILRWFLETNSYMSVDSAITISTCVQEGVCDPEMFKWMYSVNNKMFFEECLAAAKCVLSEQDPCDKEAFKWTYANNKYLFFGDAMEIANCVAKGECDFSIYQSIYTNNDFMFHEAAMQASRQAQLSRRH